MDNTPRPAPTTLYLKHRDGGMHAFNGRRCAKLCKAMAAGVGQSEIVPLIENGYIGFLARDGEVYDFEALGPTTW